MDGFLLQCIFSVLELNSTKKFKPTGGNSRFQRKTVRACQNAPFDGGHYAESNSTMLFMDINEMAEHMER